MALHRKQNMVRVVLLCVLITWYGSYILLLGGHHSLVVIKDWIINLFPGSLLSIRNGLPVINVMLLGRRTFTLWFMVNTAIERGKS